MSTSYHIYIQAADVPDGSSLAKLLVAMGGTNVARVDDTEYPDRWRLRLNGLNLELFNERLSPDRSIDVEDPEYGYDFDLAFWVEFQQDSAQTRAKVLELADVLLTHFPVLVLYNGYEELALGEQVGGSLVLVDPEPQYVVDQMAKSRGVEAWVQHQVKGGGDASN